MKNNAIKRYITYIFVYTVIYFLFVAVMDNLFNGVMLEFETLSELKKVAKGEINELTEHWSLCKKPCEVDFKDDASIDNLLSKI